MSQEPLERLGDVVRRRHERVIDETVRAASLRRSQRSPARSSRRVVLGLLVAVGSVALVVWLGRSVARTPVKTVATLEGAPLQVGDAVVVAQGPRTITVADEGQLVLDEGLLHLESNPPEVRLRLDDGHVEVRVATPSGAVWALGAGPWEVRVARAKVAATWARATERFELSVLEGEAEVRGPGQTRQLGAGERFVVEPQLESPPAPAPAPAPSAPAPQSSKRPTTTPAVPRAPAAAAKPAWLEAFKEGDFTKAVAEADRAGFAKLAGSEPPERLMLLADAYRFEQRHDEAKTLYLAARSRGRPGDATALAAFQLGVLSGESVEAADWFERAYTEAPMSPVAAQALGRLLEVRHRSRDAKAIDTARVYLSRWPDGPYASLARLLTK